MGSRTTGQWDPARTPALGLFLPNLLVIEGALLLRPKKSRVFISPLRCEIIAGRLFMTAFVRCSLPKIERVNSC
jgi:hypothetical protein